MVRGFKDSKGKYHPTDNKKKPVTGLKQNKSNAIPLPETFEHLKSARKILGNGYYVDDFGNIIAYSSSPPSSRWEEGTGQSKSSLNRYNINTDKQSL